MRADHKLEKMEPVEKTVSPERRRFQSGAKPTRDDRPPGSDACGKTVVRANDGTPLFVRRHVPPGRPVDRTLLIVHGACEHGGRYEHVIREAVSRGWQVVLGDLRGHGRSGGPRTHVRSFHQYIDDLETVRAHFALDPCRTALLGHSMGGLIACRYLQTFPERVSAAVLSSPLFGINVPVPRATVALGRVLVPVVPRCRFRSRVDPADTTRNEAVVEQRLGDPFIQRSVTAGWYFAMQDALARGHAEASRIRLPVLLLQAGRDRVVDPQAAEAWLNAVASADRTFRMFPEHFHELLNEPDWQQTMGEMLDWLEPRVTQPDRSLHPAAV